RSCICHSRSVSFEFVERERRPVTVIRLAHLSQYCAIARGNLPVVILQRRPPEYYAPFLVAPWPRGTSWEWQNLCLAIWRQSLAGLSQIFRNTKQPAANNSLG